ncbi:Early nodulin-like protein 1 [Platanthera guangdongensis]|uniref:Early nodulin-like protein 1 n=1 Tax=Platanthera guangdongensis TaxID=2320717 RepID=A0ABR2MQN6_9ASPA
MAVTGATQFRVGGSMGWAVPADLNARSYNQWAEKNRFRIGDSLCELFVYPPYEDSVLQVDEKAYANCNTSSYIAKFADGNTVFFFNASGAFNFISGVEPNCIRNESLIVVVMAERSTPPPSPPSSPPSPPPVSSGEVPPPSSPPASSVEAPPSPPPPPTSSVEVPAPSSAPGGEASPPPPPNGASVKVAGSVGAAIGMLMFVL